MIPGNPRERDNLLDRYLDGLLSADEQRAFESQLAADSDLRRQVELQRRCDVALRSLAASPVAADLVARAVTDGPRKAIRKLSALQRVARLAVAAVVIGAVSVGGAWGISVWLDARNLANRYTAPGPVTSTRKSMSKVYAERKAADFKVDWKCKDDKEFAYTFRQRFQQALLVSASLPADVHVNGLMYENVLSGNTTVLIARVGEEGILVFIDTADHCSGGELVSGGLNSFNREIGKLSLTEVSPFDKPRILEYFIDPDKPSP